MATTKKRKVIKKQSYTIEIIHYEDGSSVMNRANDGFSVIELLGITSLVNSDMCNLVENGLKPNLPTEINRTAKNVKFID